jgi:hypothetical protein
VLRFSCVLCEEKQGIAKPPMKGSGGWGPRDFQLMENRS